MITDLIRNGAETRRPIYVLLILGGHGGCLAGRGAGRGQGKEALLVTRPCQSLLVNPSFLFGKTTHRESSADVLYENPFSGIDA